MKNDVEKVLDEKADFNGFIKVTDKPLTGLSSEQKSILNRKGNILFNEGNLEQARRIYITTGYSDGLTRIGDTYSQQKNDLKALKFYVLAHNKKKAALIYERIAKLISILLNE